MSLCELFGLDDYYWTVFLFSYVLDIVFLLTLGIAFSKEVHTITPPNRLDVCKLRQRNLVLAVDKV